MADVAYRPIAVISPQLFQVNDVRLLRTRLMHFNAFSASVPLSPFGHHSLTSIYGNTIDLSPAAHAKRVTSAVIAIAIAGGADVPEAL